MSSNPTGQIPGVAFFPQTGGSQNPNPQPTQANNVSQPPNTNSYPYQSRPSASHTQQYLHQSLPMGSTALQISAQPVIHHAPIHMSQAYRPTQTQTSQQRPPTLSGLPQAAIDLLAQGQRRYAANTQRPQMGPSSQISRPSGVPGQSLANLSQQSTMAQARKVNKKRKAPESVTPTIPRINVTPPQKMPESELLTELQSIDDAISKIITAQKREIRYSLQAQEHVKKRLRVYVQSEHFNQPHYSTYDSREPSSWSLTIWGKLLDGVGATQIMGPKPPSAGVLKVKPLSFYLKSLVIKPLEDTQTSSEENRVWEKSKHIGDNRDRFHVRHEGSSEFPLQIELAPDSQPSLWKVGEKLEKIIGTKIAPRTVLLSSLWTYVKLHNLQDKEDQIALDEKLEDLFGKTTISVTDLPSLLDLHICPLKPYVLPFTVRPELGQKSAISCFDLDIFVAMKPEEKHIAPYIDQLIPDSETEQIQLKINGLVGAANERARRRDLLLGFGSDPQAFIDMMVASQARDVRATQKGGQATALQKTEFFQAKWVENAVLRYLHRKMAAVGT